MSGHRRIFALCSIILGAALASAITVVNAGVGWVERVVLWGFGLIVKPFTMTPSWGTLAAAWAPLERYDAPSFHSLRHEAGTSRRAAARHT